MRPNILATLAIAGLGLAAAGCVAAYDGDWDDRWERRHYYGDHRYDRWDRHRDDRWRDRDHDWRDRRHDRYRDRYGRRDEDRDRDSDRWHRDW